MREQVVKRWPKGHSVDDKFAVVGERQDDHFKELAIAARDRSRAPSADLRRVHADDDVRMVDGVDDLFCGDAVSSR